MWIESITPNTSDWAGKIILLDSGINIIRGDNGIGKTTILEYASLLGHVVLMKAPADPSSESSVTLKVHFDERDKQFLKYVAENADFSIELRNYARSVDVDEGLFADVDAEKVATDFDLKFVFEGADINDIKDILASDKKIRRHIKVYCALPDAVKLIKIINLWSRPIEIDATNSRARRWAITPRTRSAIESKEIECPGSTFYLNTDMYEFGAGLDVRESPKDLQKHLVDVMIRRLQIVHPSSIPTNRICLAECFTTDTKKKVENSEFIKSAWDEIFACRTNLDASGLVFDNDELLKSGHSFGYWQLEYKNGRFSWDINIAGQTRKGIVSSGENQALFILSMLANFGQSGSCIIIDEPELHLSFSVGSKLVSFIIDNFGINAIRSQVIMVTHLPHLYRDRVIDDELEELSDSFKRDVNFIYIRVVGADKEVKRGIAAVSAASKSSHDDVRALANGLRVDGKVHIPIVSNVELLLRYVSGVLALPHLGWHIAASLLILLFFWVIPYLSDRTIVSACCVIAAVLIFAQWVWYCLRRYNHQPTVEASDISG